MSYQQFAYYYDRLMQDAPYEKWIDFLERTADCKAARILDIGCGTGAVSIRLAEKGFDVTAVDLSEDMLAMAREKAENQKLNVRFFHQDMRELDGLGVHDIAVIFCDSLNYLLSEEDVYQTFQSIYNHLHMDGKLLFDVHSLYKIHHIFSGNTFGSNEEHLSYIWQCFDGELPDSIEHELSFFVQKDGAYYERFDEIHIQRTFSIETYEHLLQKAGFVVERVTADFLETPPDHQSERLFFVAKKAEKPSF
ncbi:methyltransferase domain-containing protein [Fictibacillus sp. Mic-4]|uniref:class I SAM-dependent DNA methyltransferase n=1 Tax=Fictibacillus TaxID=1329200 RepID=UPI0004118BB4|nr:class I SAM-dependent methyltransferase [Fictibacillus gelatini]